MPHPIYGPPDHQLEYVEFKLVLPLRSNGYKSRVDAYGHSQTRRGTLWSSTEQWTHDMKGDEYGPTDSLHHLALVALQDRPTSPTALELALRGGHSTAEQVPLF